MISPIKWWALRLPNYPLSAPTDSGPCPIVNEPLRRTGTHELTSTSIAELDIVCKANRYELAADVHSRNWSFATPRKQASAARASGERSRSESPARMAPRPQRSSRAGRRLSSSQRSPAAMTQIAALAEWLIACWRAIRATAEALRGHPAITHALSSAPWIARVAPLGEGSTTRAPGEMPVRDRGESEKG